MLGNDTIYSGTKPIWDIVFDRTSGKTFSNPEHLTGTIYSKKHELRWPLLSESIKRRDNKIKKLGISKYKEDLTKKHPTKYNKSIPKVTDYSQRTQKKIKLKARHNSSF